MRAIGASLQTRVGSAAAVAILAAGGVLAGTAAAGAATGHPKHEPTTLSIKNKVIAHGKHHADALTGVLSADHKGVAGATITLDSRTGKKPRWTAVAESTTGSNGSITFIVMPSATTQYKLVFAGTSAYAASHSNVITLKALKS